MAASAFPCATAHDRAAVGAQCTDIAAEAGADLRPVRNEIVAKAEGVVLAGLLGVDLARLRGGRRRDEQEAQQQAGGR